MFKRHIRAYWAVLLVLLVTLINPFSTQAQDDPELRFIAKLVEQMSPQAKIGQLFIVAFSGADVAAGSDIASLILDYNVGGVIVSPAAGNIVGEAAAEQTAALTASLQGLARTASQTVNPSTGRASPFIPLFIAMPYSTQVMSYTHEINGMTPLPSPLAMGATWTTKMANEVGNLAGQELAAMGINVLLGPSLDVLTTPSEPSSPTGLQVFGGDPYWVSVMGQAFARGVHEGSKNRVAVVPAHFPGQGKATSSEGTIDKSLDEMKKLDMLPFLQMITAPPTGETRPLIGALMMTQMRYRGFSGNIRERTRPLAVDGQAMQLLLDLPEVKAWRDGSGVLFSNSLGSPALQQYYAPLGAPPYRIAQEAFLAGNNVLVLSDFGGQDWKAQFNAITSTIVYFQDKYSTDLAFQTRVNDAVARILRMKYRMYPDFEPLSVPADAQAVSTVVGKGQALTAQVAQAAVTQLWPTERPVAPLPAIDPQSNMVIITDDRLLRDCPTCTRKQIIATDALASAIEQRYAANGRLDPARITSLGLNDAYAFLGGTPREGGPDVVAALQAADWVVLVVIDTQTEPTSALVKQLLIGQTELLGDANTVVFTLGVPRALDKDALNRLTAHYCLYGNSAPFIDVAAQILFGDLPAPGAFPISVPALGYDITRQTEPDPNQFIQILIGEIPTGEQVTPQPVTVKAGDKLKLRTGVILDRNGHPVPDGTPVTFTRLFSESIELPALTVGTSEGVAIVEITLDKDKIGPLRIRAYSEPALTSYELRMTIFENQPSVFATVIPPTLTPTPKPSTPAPTRSPTATPTPTPTPVPPWYDPLTQPDAPRRVNLLDLFAALVGIAAVGLAAYYLRLNFGEQNSQHVAATRLALWCSGAGLTGYILYGLGTPGIAALDSLGSLLASLLVSAISAALPLAAVWGWQQIDRSSG